MDVLSSLAAVAARLVDLGLIVQLVGDSWAVWALVCDVDRAVVPVLLCTPSVFSLRACSRTIRRVVRSVVIGDARWRVNRTLD